MFELAVGLRGIIRGGEVEDLAEFLDYNRSSARIRREHQWCVSRESAPSKELGPGT